MTTRVLAFDQATTSGWAFGTEDTPPVFGRFKMPDRPDHERLYALYKFALGKARQYEPELIVHETPYFPLHDMMKRSPVGSPDMGLEGGGGSGPFSGKQRAPFNPKTVKWLQKVEATIMLVSAELSIPVEDYSPSTWRGTLLGFSRAPKGADGDFIKRAVFNKIKSLGYDATSKDEADVLGILYHALHGDPAVKRNSGDLFAMATSTL